MAKITRKTQKIFGGNYISNPTQTDIAVFGSQKDGTPNYSVDVDDIQNSNFLDGWKEAVITSGDGKRKMPALQDANALIYALSRQLSYLYQAGVAEYDTQTTYYTGDICRKTGTTEIYSSKIDDNLNQSYVDGANWQYLGDLKDLISVAQATESQRGTAEIATQAEVEAKTDDSRIVTALKLAFGFQVSLSANGYIKMPNWLGGLILQWGRTSTASTDATVVFSLAFPNSAFSVFANADTDSTAESANTNVTALSTTSFRIRSNSSQIFYWFAIGN